jgi:L-amino acid N-acyltransferase YncA
MQHTCHVEGIRAIYAPIVDTTHISFELEVPSLDEIARRIAGVTDRHVDGLSGRWPAARRR